MNSCGNLTLLFYYPTSHRLSRNIQVPNNIVDPYQPATDGNILRRKFDPTLRRNVSLSEGRKLERLTEMTISTDIGSPKQRYMLTVPNL